MILLTRINRKPIVINADLIEHVEVTPDTVITMTTGQKFVVLDSAQEVVEKTVAFRKSVQRECMGVRSCGGEKE
jgi:flagellar protein FlbD